MLKKFATIGEFMQGKWIVPTKIVEVKTNHIYFKDEDGSERIFEDRFGEVKALFKGKKSNQKYWLKREKTQDGKWHWKLDVPPAA